MTDTTRNIPQILVGVFMLILGSMYDLTALLIIGIVLTFIGLKGKEVKKRVFHVPSEEKPDILKGVEQEDAGPEVKEETKSDVEDSPTEESPNDETSTEETTSE